MKEILTDVFPVFQQLFKNPYGGISMETYMTSYTKIFDQMCTDNPSGDKIYEAYKNLVSRFVTELVSQTTELSDLELLKFFGSKWEWFIKSNKCVNGMCGYLNRTWIKQNMVTDDEIHFISKCSDLIWRDKMFKPLAKRLTTIVLTKIKELRNNGNLDPEAKNLVQNTISCFIKLSNQLDLYLDFFQGDFLADSRDYYHNESTAQIGQQRNICEYFKYAERRINEENELVKYYLYNNSSKELEQILNQEVISNHLTTILSQLNPLLEAEQCIDLTRLYFLLKRLEPVEGLQPLANAFQQYIVKVGLGTLEKEQADKPNIFTEVLLKLLRRFNLLVQIYYSKKLLIVLLKYLLMKTPLLKKFKVMTWL